MEKGLEQYAKIQPMVIKDAHDQALKVYAEKATQYSVPTVPVHSHSGTDSPQIPFPNLENASSYRVLRTVTLTSAQVKALNTTPVTLVPAAGLNTLIIVEHITARVNFITPAYTGANALEFRYTNGSGVKVTVDLPAAFITSAASAYYHAPATGTALVPVANAPIVVSVPTADPATGNSTMTFKIVYRVVPFNT